MEDYFTIILLVLPAFLHSTSRQHGIPTVRLHDLARAAPPFLAKIAITILGI